MAASPDRLLWHLAPQIFSPTKSEAGGNQRYAKKMQMQKRNAKQIEIKNTKYIVRYCKFKNANAENSFGHPLDSDLGGRAGFAVSVAWLSCILVLEFVSHAICARMSFSSVWGFLSLHQHLNRHIDFQERVGGWHSPPAQVPDAAFRESGGPFPRG